MLETGDEAHTIPVRYFTVAMSAELMQHAGRIDLGVVLRQVDVPAIHVRHFVGYRLDQSKQRGPFIGNPLSGSDRLGHTGNDQNSEPISRFLFDSQGLNESEQAVDANLQGVLQRIRAVDLTPAGFVCPEVDHLRESRAIGGGIQQAAIICAVIRSHAVATRPETREVRTRFYRDEAAMQAFKLRTDAFPQPERIQEDEGRSLGFGRDEGDQVLAPPGRAVEPIRQCLGLSAARIDSLQNLGEVAGLEALTKLRPLDLADFGLGNVLPGHRNQEVRIDSDAADDPAANLLQAAPRASSRQRAERERTRPGCRCHCPTHGRCTRQCMRLQLRRRPRRPPRFRGCRNSRR